VTRRFEDEPRATQHGDDRPEHPCDDGEAWPDRDGCPEQRDADEEQVVGPRA
jgi:hypothetical protein